MPAAPKAKAKTGVVEAILPVQDPKKHSMHFREEDGADQDVTNIYLKNRGMAKLGNPKAVKVTIEAYDGE